MYLLSRVDAHHGAIVTSRDLGGSAIDSVPVTVSSAVVDLVGSVGDPD